MNRTYEKTHPWIDFRPDLNQAPAKLWYLLGKVEAKIEQIKASFLPPTEARELMSVHLVRGVAATTAIEGNSLSLDEVRKILDNKGKSQRPSSKQYLEWEVRNVLDLYNTIGNQILDGEQSRLTPETILSYNKRLLADLPRDERASPPGVFRSHPVHVAQYVGAPVEDLRYLTSHLCDWLYSYFEPLREYGSIEYGIVRAILAHLYIAWIHPFADGNGRTARALEFHILLAAGIPDVAVHLLSNYYNETRAEYYRQLSISSRKATVFLFLEYAIQGFVESLQQTLEEIAKIQTRIHWEHFVHEQFASKDTETGLRRQELVLALHPNKYVPIREIPFLTPRLAAFYAGKTRKTIRRDLNTLKKMGLQHEVGLPGLTYEAPTGLIEETSEGIRAQVELIFAFRPRTRQP